MKFKVGDRVYLRKGCSLGLLDTDTAIIRTITSVSECETFLRFNDAKIGWDTSNFELARGSRRELAQKVTNEIDAVLRANGVHLETDSWSICIEEVYEPLPFDYYEVHADGDERITLDPESPE
jgi:hypothetical protein